MLQAAARVAHNVEAETRAYEIRMRAARKAGELSKKIEKAHGNQYGKSDSRTKLDVLAEAGIPKQRAADWEHLSDVPQDEFEAALATRSVRDLIDKATPVSGDVMAEGVELARRVNDGG